jgi:hypothetical protein
VVFLDHFHQLAPFLVGEEAQPRQDLLLRPTEAVVLVAPALRPKRALAELPDVMEEPAQGDERPLRCHVRTTSIRPSPILVSFPTPSHSPKASRGAKGEKSTPS